MAASKSACDTASFVFRWWDRIEETVVALLGLIALVIGLLQVIGRYFDPARSGLSYTVLEGRQQHDLDLKP